MIYAYEMPELVNKFCDAVDPDGNFDYLGVFQKFGKEIGARYDFSTEAVIFETEKAELAFILKYS